MKEQVHALVIANTEASERSTALEIALAQSRQEVSGCFKLLQELLLRFQALSQGRAPPGALLPTQQQQPNQHAQHADHAQHMQHAQHTHHLDHAQHLQLQQQQLLDPALGAVGHAAALQAAAATALTVAAANSPAAAALLRLSEHAASPISPTPPTPPFSGPPSIDPMAPSTGFLAPVAQLNAVSGLDLSDAARVRPPLGTSLPSACFRLRFRLRHPVMTDNGGSWYAGDLSGGALCLARTCTVRCQ